ncbi:MAG: STAS domain-containing protein [Desulfobacula sp.]|jgi:anti-anti-sigma factor|nr:STAS domain-containing protein [Desulfobacula sp.]
MMTSRESNGSGKDIIVKNVNGKTVLAPETSLTLKNRAQLETLFDGLVKQGVKDIILDLKKVSFLDSSALELMVDMQVRLKSAGGDLSIFNLNEVCRDTLICVRLINRFNVIANLYGS